MPSKLLDGKWLSKLIQGEIGAEVERLCGPRNGGPRKRAPGLGVILVGDNPASHAYVTSKGKVAKACGFHTFDRKLPSSTSAGQLREVIEEFNRTTEVDGILLQLPLPQHLASNDFLDLVDPGKDADGLHPLNQGMLMRGTARVKPCTPLGCLRLIDLAFSKVEPGTTDVTYKDIPFADLSGKLAVVLGRSILVGKPVSLLLLERNATVTVAHSKTSNLADLVRQADILVAAVGLPNLVRGDWLAPSAVVIDVGINRTAEGTLTGDVCFDEAFGKVQAITPVPGGVGPMTVTMLMYNTLSAYRRSER